MCWSHYGLGSPAASKTPPGVGVVSVWCLCLLLVPTVGRRYSRCTGTIVAMAVTLLHQL